MMPLYIVGPHPQPCPCSVIIPLLHVFILTHISSHTDLQASSALAEASAQLWLRRWRRRTAASPRVRLRLSSFSTSRSADRLLSSRRPDCKHMVASQTQRDHNSLDDGAHAITAGDPNMLRTRFVFFCPHLVHCYFKFSTSFKFIDLIFCTLSLGNNHIIKSLKWIEIYHSFWK